MASPCFSANYSIEEKTFLTDLKIQYSKILSCREIGTLEKNTIQIQIYLTRCMASTGLEEIWDSKCYERRLLSAAVSIDPILQWDFFIKHEPLHTARISLEWIPFWIHQGGFRDKGNEWRCQGFPL
ncbi:hypothetical protein SUGI_0293440 [Cryptomeria japonica]|nr:hypothetical protein SUGI_0293440 [Cryptomeria japonica]